ncbi:MAG: hypothetical protein AAFO57_00525 [Pseudomonadota bacterium]
MFPLFRGGASEDPSEQLREIADDLEAGRIRGVVISYVRDDGEVGYKLMGALAKTSNLGNAIGIIGELKRRVELLFSGT